MRVGIQEFLERKGDVYFFKVVYSNSESKEVVKIGGPDEAAMFTDFGIGKLFLYLFDNLGKFFYQDTLSEVIGVKPISLISYMGTLDDRLSYSKFYQLLLRREGKKKAYGVVEREQEVEGRPVRNSKRIARNRKSLDNL